MIGRLERTIHVLIFCFLRSRWRALTNGGGAAAATVCWRDSLWPITSLREISLPPRPRTSIYSWIWPFQATGPLELLGSHSCFSHIAVLTGLIHNLILTAMAVRCTGAQKLLYWARSRSCLALQYLWYSVKFFFFLPVSSCCFRSRQARLPVWRERGCSYLGTQWVSLGEKDPGCKGDARGPGAAAPAKRSQSGFIGKPSWGQRGLAGFGDLEVGVGWGTSRWKTCRQTNSLLSHLLSLSWTFYSFKFLVFHSDKTGLDFKRLLAFFGRAHWRREAWQTCCEAQLGLGCVVSSHQKANAKPQKTVS